MESNKNSTFVSQRISHSSSKRIDITHFRELSYFHTSNAESTLPADDVKTETEKDLENLPTNNDDAVTTDEEK